MQAIMKYSRAIHCLKLLLHASYIRHCQIDSRNRCPSGREDSESWSTIKPPEYTNIIARNCSEHRCAKLDWITVNSCLCAIGLDGFVRFGNKPLERRCVFVYLRIPPLTAAPLEQRDKGRL